MNNEDDNEYKIFNKTKNESFYKKFYDHKLTTEEMKEIIEFFIIYEPDENDPKIWEITDEIYITSKDDIYYFDNSDYFLLLTAIKRDYFNQIKKIINRNNVMLDHHLSKYINLSNNATIIKFLFNSSSKRKKIYSENTRFWHNCKYG